MTARRAVASVIAPALAAGLLVAGPAAPPAAAEGSDCTQITDAGTESTDEPDPSVPAAQMRIADVHDRLREKGVEPGARVTVAVVSSGVAGSVADSWRRMPRRSFASAEPPSHYEGTAVAGVVAGPAYDGEVVGLAPAAQLRDVKVYDELTTSDSTGDAVGLSADRLALGLQALAEDPPHIVVVPVAVNRTEALGSAVDALLAKGVIVVAAGGDRPQDEGHPLWDDFGESDGERGPEPGEDAAKGAWPAGYEGVVAVGAAVTDGTEPAELILQNSAIDIAVPTADAVSYGVNGKPCVLPTASTAIAAGEIAGILALLKSAYRDDNREQLLARLFHTATGDGVDPEHNDNMFTGHGIAQPLEAMVRPMRPDRKGNLLELSNGSGRDGPVAVPEREPDLLARTREDAVWWGLLGAGALLIALLLSRVVRSRAERR